MRSIKKFATLALLTLMCNTTFASEVRISFINVDHGDGSLIEFTNGEVMLIDTAKLQFAKADLIPYLKNKLKSNRIDYLVLTHNHADHLGGFFDVANNFQIGQVWTPGAPLPKPIQSILNKKKIPVVSPALGSEKQIGQSSLFILNNYDKKRCSTSFFSNDINECSLGMKLSFGNFSVLFGADMMAKATERARTLFPTQVQADVLKMQHHGIRQAFMGEWLDTVKPQVAISSASQRDPTPEVLKFYQDRKITVYETRRDGDIVLSTDGIKFMVNVTNRHALGFYIKSVKPYYNDPALDDETACDREHGD